MSQCVYVSFIHQSAIACDCDNCWIATSNHGFATFNGVFIQYRACVNYHSLHWLHALTITTTHEDNCHVGDVTIDVWQAASPSIARRNYHLVTRRHSSIWSASFFLPSFETRFFIKWFPKKCAAEFLCSSG